MTTYMFRCTEQHSTAVPEDLYQRVVDAIAEVRCSQAEVYVDLSRLMTIKDSQGPIVLADVCGPIGWSWTNDRLMWRHHISCSPCG